MIILCCCFSGDTCSYGSRATQILELGVSEFCSTVPNSHVKSRIYFRVLSQNSQKGEIVRLNLINHFVGFIPCQFACNSTLRNPIFRWESCKGIV